MLVHEGLQSHHGHIPNQALQIAYREYSDTMSLADLQATNQTFANVQYTSPPNNDTTTSFPHDGLVGFAAKDISELGATPFFHNLCNQGVLEECRFGLAYGTNNVGQQILGGVDHSLFSGSLSVAPISDEWNLNGDLTINGKVFASQVTVYSDSGTANIVG